MSVSEVYVPGDFVATYEDGRITRLVFVPSASNAGYFGPAAVVVSGPGTDGSSLDVETTDGPFWSAMQEALKEGRSVEWEE